MQQMPAQTPSCSPAPTACNTCNCNPAPCKTGLMPDLSRMALKDAIYILENQGLSVQVVGRGTINAQSIAPGTRISKGQTHHPDPQLRNNNEHATRHIFRHPELDNYGATRP